MQFLCILDAYPTSRSADRCQFSARHFDCHRVVMIQIEANRHSAAKVLRRLLNDKLNPQVLSVVPAVGHKRRVGDRHYILAFRQYSWQ
jgi:hypothetical protein